MSTDSESRIEELAREKMEGKSYSSIRNELEESGMNDGEISFLLRQVDERVLGETVKQGDRDRAQQWYRTGLILAGILVMFYGRSLRKKQSASTDKGTGAIRRKRPFK
jgi:hypothetical protein